MTQTSEPRKMRGVILKDGTHYQTHGAERMHGVEPIGNVYYAETISESVNGVHVVVMKKRHWQSVAATNANDPSGGQKTRLHTYEQETLMLYPWHTVERYYHITETDE